MKCTCPTKFDEHTSAIVRAALDQFCAVHGQKTVAAPGPVLTEEQLEAIRWALLRLSPNWPREGEKHLATLRELTRTRGSEAPTSHNHGVKL